MRKLYAFFLLWLLTLPAYAQQQSANPLDSLRQQLNYVFAHVDKSQVPTQYLEDFGVRLLPFRPFNGTLSDTCLLNMPTFRQLYATAFSSHVQEASSLPLLSDLNADLAARMAASTAIPVVVQRIDYAALRRDALRAGLFTNQGGQLYDVPGRTASPYLLRTLFAASPGTNVSATGEVSFVFAPSLHVQSGGGAVSAIRIDFGDGQGYQTAAWNQPISASYCAAGTYRVKVRLTYVATKADQQRAGSDTFGKLSVSYESQFDLNVLAANCFRPGLRILAAMPTFDTVAASRPIPCLTNRLS